MSIAKKQILDYLVEQDWSLTELAEKLGKSPETLYNHLNERAGQSVLTKTQVAAKTEYSIGDGFAANRPLSSNKNRVTRSAPFTGVMDSGVPDGFDRYTESHGEATLGTA